MYEKQIYNIIQYVNIFIHHLHTWLLQPQFYQTILKTFSKIFRIQTISHQKYNIIRFIIKVWKYLVFWPKCDSTIITCTWPKCISTSSTIPIIFYTSWTWSVATSHGPMCSVTARYNIIVVWIIALVLVELNLSQNNLVGSSKR